MLRPNGPPIAVGEVRSSFLFQVVKLTFRYSLVVKYDTDRNFDRCFTDRNDLGAHDFKNTITNALFMHTSAAMYVRHNDHPEYLTNAKNVRGP